MGDTVYSAHVEEKILRFWEENGIYKKAKAKNKGKKKFYFLDGPPYASGFLHIGHMWGRALKDLYVRYHRMLGYDVYDRPGWDCHGTPIEVKVEKDFGITSKKEIEEKIGIGRFIEACREKAVENIDTMTQQSKDFGMWFDWERAYRTLYDWFIEEEWRTFKAAWEKGLIYRDKYPVHVCPRCGTVVSASEIVYAELEDPSIFVAFPVKGEENAYFLVWTTTPWTLPANVAIMAHPDEVYVKVRVNDRYYILAEKRLEPVAKEIGWTKYEVVDRFQGSTLYGKEYEPVLGDEVPIQRQITHMVVLSDRFVTMDEGTGLVHSAPGHGREDFLVGKEYNLPVLSPVRMDGTFTEEAGKYAGMFVKDADKVIIQDLRRKGLLVYEGKIKHSYPTCWRCDTPLLLISVEEWFLNVEKIRDTMRDEAKKVEWVPDWMRDRFLDWVENLRDWPLTRQRFWGTPAPIWICEQCGHVEVIGDREELKRKAVKLPDRLELHRPWVDKVVLKCPKCGGTMRRIPDVLDVWFDSGCVPWAVFNDKEYGEKLERWFPVDLEIEGPDQVRGWWNSQMILSIVRFGVTPFTRILVSGFILDVHGNKMSKSKGNVILLEELYRKGYTRDVLRAYYYSLDLGRDVNLSWDALNLARSRINVYWNLKNLLKRQINMLGIDPEKDRTTYLAPEDHWILSRLQATVEEVREYMGKWDHEKASEALLRFIVDEFSRVYVKIVRERLKLPEKDPSRIAAVQTMYDVMKTLCVLTAPFFPFISEAIYQEIVRRDGKPESVHLLDYPEPKKHLRDISLEKKFEVILSAAEAVFSARQRAGIKLRWPLSEVVIITEDPSVFEGVRDPFLRYVNAKNLRFSSEPPLGYVEADFVAGRVYIPPELDEETKKEALAREVLRRIQQMRKKMGLVEVQEVIAEIWGDEDLLAAVRTHQEEIKRKAGIRELIVSKERILEGEAEEFNVEGMYLRITLRLVGEKGA